MLDLAQRRFFDKPAFNNFLLYLRYWKRPEYAKFIRPGSLSKPHNNTTLRKCFIRYPQCLAFLDLLTDDSIKGKNFRDEMKKPEFQASDNLVYIAKESSNNIPNLQQFVHEQCFNQWQFSGTARLRELEELPRAADIASWVGEGSGGLGMEVGTAELPSI